jgi:hypothetical protein
MDISTHTHTVSYLKHIVILKYVLHNNSTHDTQHKDTDNFVLFIDEVDSLHVHIIHAEALTQATMTVRTQQAGHRSLATYMDGIGLQCMDRQK